MSTACLALEICCLACNVSKHGLEVSRGKRCMLLSDRFIPIIHKRLERTEDFWTEQRNLSRRLTPGPFHSAQCLNKDGKLIQETVLRRRSLLIAYIPLSGSINSTENLAKSRLRNQFGAEELCLIPHILLPTSENIVEGLLLGIRIREKVVGSFEQPNMREVLCWPSLYIKLRTSRLDTGLEQEYTCSIRLLNAPGKVSVLHTARPIEKARTSLAPSLR